MNLPDIINKLPYISSPNGISNHDYHEDRLFESSSGMKHYMISPKYHRWAKENPSQIGIEAALKGSVYHEMLASITNKGDLSEFEQNYFTFQAPINPKTGKSYGYGTQAWQTEYDLQLEANPGKEICTADETKLAKMMIEELTGSDSQKSRDVNHLIKYGKAEVSIFAEHEGMHYKIREDLRTPTKIADWKTGPLGFCREDEFSKQIIKFGYHISAAMYQFIDRLATGKWRKFYWIAQEKEPPFDFMIHDASNWTWEIGNSGDDETIEPKLGGLIFLKLMEIHAWCSENNRYPGYEFFTQPDWKGHRLAMPEIPGYAKNKLFQYFEF